MKLLAKFSAFFHEVSRKFAQIRALVTRFYAFLRVRLFFKEEVDHGWTLMDADMANWMRAKPGAGVGSSGRAVANRVETARFSPRKLPAARLGPPSPTLIFLAGKLEKEL